MKDKERQSSQRWSIDKPPPLQHYRQETRREQLRPRHGRQVRCSDTSRYGKGHSSAHRMATPASGNVPRYSIVVCVCGSRSSSQQVTYCPPDNKRGRADVVGQRGKQTYAKSGQSGSHLAIQGGHHPPRALGGTPAKQHPMSTRQLVVKQHAHILATENGEDKYFIPEKAALSPNCHLLRLPRSNFCCNLTVAM